MRCGEIFAFLFHFGDLTVLNTGSANFLPETLKGTVCDYFFCGVSKWQQGFPRMCAENVRFGCLVPTHYDQFYDQPLTSFSLRDDFQRFRTELLRILPAAKFREPEILEYITL